MLHLWAGGILSLLVVHPVVNSGILSLFSLPNVLPAFPQTCTNTVAGVYLR